MSKELLRITEKEKRGEADGHFSQFLDLLEKTNQEMVKQGKLPIISQQEKQDLETNTHQKGWVKYWEKRLVPEMDILPKPIKNIIKKMVNQEKNNGKEIDILAIYINKRLAILKFNTQKRLEMAKLKQRLRDIDKEEGYPEKETKERRTIFYSKSENELFIYENDKKKKVTFGDIVADYEWNVKYQPDKSVPKKTWRKIRQLSDITEARRTIEEIFNKELSSIEKVCLATTNIPTEALEKLLKKAPRVAIGAIAERMAKTFLLRLQYNNPELNLVVEPSNAMEDTELKYDFKIAIPQKRRGIAIKGDKLSRKEFVAAKRRLGIQFTISKKLGILEKKKSQIEQAREKISQPRYIKFVKKPVDDIILVSLPLKTYINYFKKWLNAGKPSGGPEQYLTREEKRKLFETIAHNFLKLSKEEIEKII